MRSRRTLAPREPAGCSEVTVTVLPLGILLALALVCDRKVTSGKEAPIRWYLQPHGAPRYGQVPDTEHTPGPLLLPPDGWYPDSHGVPGVNRWWTGTQWTERTQLAPSSPIRSSMASGQHLAGYWSRWWISPRLHHPGRDRHPAAYSLWWRLSPDDHHGRKINQSYHQLRRSWFRHPRTGCIGLGVRNTLHWVSPGTRRRG